MDPTEIDWDALLAEAIDAMKHAYCSYSNLPVGAVDLTADGWLVSGCNVENTGCGVTLYVECGMAFDFIRSGGGALVVIVAVNGNEELVAPCRRCHQLIYKHGGPSCLVLVPDGVAPMAEVLSGALGPHDLLSVARAAPASSEEKEGRNGSL